MAKLLFLIFTTCLIASVTPLKWGIAGSGNIANDFVNALKVLPKSDHEVAAIAARKLESAKNFAEKHDITNAYEGYLKLAKDPNVDVVYVAVITIYHYDVVKLMLENGKHVLCEKSLTINANQTADLLTLAKNKNLFLMEGIWSRCFPAYEELRRILDAGELGKIQEVTASLGAKTQSYRFRTKDLKSSTVLDFGIYPLQLQQFVYHGLIPDKIVSSGTITDDGIDLSANTTLSYPRGKTAKVYASSEVQLPKTAVIVGTKGSVTIPNLIVPTKLIKNGVTQEFPILPSNATFVHNDSPGFIYEAEEVRKCITQGKLESSKVPHADTLQLAQWMDTIRAQIGAAKY